MAAPPWTPGCGTWGNQVNTPIGGTAMPFVPADPFYETGPAGWVRQRVEAIGVRLELDYSLETPGHITPDTGTVIARPGLSLPTFHWLMACASVAHMFGPEWTPDLPVAAPVAVHQPEALIIPFQRPPFAAGQWRRYT